MNYTADGILEQAKLTDKDRAGRAFVEITLEKGDVAWCPGSTKKVLRGEGRVTYEIAPWGNTATKDASVYISDEIPPEFVS